MGLEILKINKSDPLVAKVVDLADRHRNLLGIIPRGAFAEFAQDGLILAALMEGEFAGYVLYRYIKSRNEVSITHLCVEPECRGNNVALSLVQRLSEKFAFALGISLKCRVDFPANALWPKIGFAAKREMQGRSKEGTLLRLWWRDHGHPTIFGPQLHFPRNRLKAAIDANVFFDLADDSRPSSESLGLLADWLIEEVDFLYTPELENEIAQGEDLERRNSQRLLLHKMTLVSSPIQTFECEHARINSILPPPNNDRDRADRRHVAWAISGRVNLFVSRDDLLLKTCRDFLGDFDLEALRPSELLVRVDRLQNEARYNPARVAGAVSITSHKPTKLSTQDIAPLANTAMGEKARDLTRTLRELLADPQNANVRIIKEDEELLGSVGTKHQGRTSRIVILRTRPNTHYSPTLASEMVAHAILECVERGTEFTEVQDALAGSDIEQALGEFGFVRGEHSWLKWSRRGIRTVSELLRDIDQLPGTHRRLADRLRPILKTAASAENTRVLAEQILWPLKVTGSGSQNFILPIRPHWAKELFDSEYSKIDLFGCDPKLMLRRENAYYRSASGACPPSGSRLLWYVSRHGRFPNSGAVRATSLVEDALVLPAREAFRRGRRFGIYKRTNVIETAGGPDKPVMVIFFTGIEEFVSPQPFSTVNEVLEEHGQAPNQFQSIVPITESAFDRIYRNGMEID